MDHRIGSRWTVIAFMVLAVVLGVFVAIVVFWIRSGDVATIGQTSEMAHENRADIELLKANDKRQDADIEQLKASRLIAKVQDACGPWPGIEYYAVGTGTAEDPYRWANWETELAEEIRHVSALYDSELGSLGEESPVRREGRYRGVESVQGKPSLPGEL